MGNAYAAIYSDGYVYYECVTLRGILYRAEEYYVSKQKLDSLVARIVSEGVFDWDQYVHPNSNKRDSVIDIVTDQPTVDLSFYYNDRTTSFSLSKQSTQQVQDLIQDVDSLLNIRQFWAIDTLNRELPPIQLPNYDGQPPRIEFTH